MFSYTKDHMLQQTLLLALVLNGSTFCKVQRKLTKWQYYLGALDIRLPMLVLILSQLAAR